MKGRQPQERQEGEEFERRGEGGERGQKMEEVKGRSAEQNVEIETIRKWQEEAERRTLTTENEDPTRASERNPSREGKKRDRRATEEATTAWERVIGWCTAHTSSTHSL